MKIKGKDGEDSDTVTLTVVKIKGKWYLAHGSLFSSLL